MVQFIQLSPEKLSISHKIDSRLVSYNVEMTEVTGGTFWKRYTTAQIEGTEPFSVKGDLSNFLSSGDLMQWYNPINLYNPKLRYLSKSLGKAWVRVSGSWATKTYYDFDDSTNGVAPEGYQSVLTKKQWIGVLDFVKAINAKLLISVNNCEGLHKASEPWHPGQAKLLFETAKEIASSIS